jgi:hypothetical protein
VGKFSVDVPIARFVCVGQRRALNRHAKAHVVELRGLGRQAGFDIAQDFSIGQLGECHRPVLLGAEQRSNQLSPP